MSDDPSKPAHLKRGDRVYLKFGDCRHGVLTADQSGYLVRYALDTDNRNDPAYGSRIATRNEVSPIKEPASMGATIGELLKARTGR